MRWAAPVIQPTHSHSVFSLSSVCLCRYHAVARKLASMFDVFQAEHIFREKNTHADRLSNEAVVEQRLWTLTHLEEELFGGGGKRKREER